MLSTRLYIEDVARSYGRKRRGGSSGAPVDATVSLCDQTIKLYDKQDSNGADWAAEAIVSLQVAFFCLQNLPEDDPSRAAITRRAHDFAYSLMAGSPDSDAPFTATGDRPQRSGVLNDGPGPEAWA